MFTLLKLKSLFYRHTGIYLADKEENDYLTSYDFWKSFNEYKSHPENDLSDRNIQGILIGLWQCNHKFYRSYGRSRWDRLRRKIKRRAKK